MKKPKLSAAQIKVLRALAEPGVVAENHGYLYWSITGKGRIGQHPTMKRLFLLSLLTFANDSRGFAMTATISPAGRDYLAGLEGKEDA